MVCHLIFLRMMRALSCLLALAWSISVTPSLTADENLEGSSSSKSKQEAIRRIPLHLLTPDAQSKLTAVLDKPSIFRHMPSQTMRCDPEMFVFLVRYPEVMVNLWDLMGVTKVTIQRTAPFEFKGADGAGTQCRAELVYGTEHLHVYYGLGEYTGTLVKNGLHGRCVCVIQSHMQKQANGQTMVHCNMDVFLKFDNVGADLVARTISPFVAKTADYNFSESSRFIEQLSQAAERNPDAVKELADRMDSLQPAVRSEFIDVTMRVATRTEKQSATRLTSTSNHVVPNAQGMAQANGEIILQELSAPRRVIAAGQSAITPEKTEVILRR